MRNGENQSGSLIRELRFFPMKAGSFRVKRSLTITKPRESGRILVKRALLNPIAGPSFNYPELNFGVCDIVRRCETPMQFQKTHG